MNIIADDGIRRWIHSADRKYNKFKGDYIDDLKVQIASEQQIVISACIFYTLIHMIQVAEAGFRSLDWEYTVEKIK